MLNLATALLSVMLVGPAPGGPTAAEPAVVALRAPRWQGRHTTASTAGQAATPQGLRDPFHTPAVTILGPVAVGDDEAVATPSSIFLRDPFANARPSSQAAVSGQRGPARHRAAAPRVPTTGLRAPFDR